MAKPESKICNCCHKPFYRRNQTDKSWKSTVQCSYKCRNEYKARLELNKPKDPIIKFLTTKWACTQLVTHKIC